MGEQTSTHVTYIAICGYRTHIDTVPVGYCGGDVGEQTSNRGSQVFLNFRFTGYKPTLTLIKC